MKTKIIAISVILAAVFTASCGESGNQPGDESPSVIPASASEYLTEPIESPPEAISPTPDPIVNTPDPITELSPVLAEFVELLKPLTTKNPGRTIDFNDLDAYIPAKRVGETLTYDELCMLFERSVTRESYDAPQGEEAVFGYETYISDYGEKCYKPFKLNYNGISTVFVLHGTRTYELEGYSINTLKKGEFNASDEYFRTDIDNRDPLIFGFYEYAGEVFFVYAKKYTMETDDFYTSIDVFSHKTAENEINRVYIRSGAAELYHRYYNYQTDEPILSAPATLDDLSPEFMRYIEAIRPLTVQIPGRKLSTYDIDSNFPGTRIDRPLTYDEFCDFYAQYSRYGMGYGQDFAECTQENYNAPQNRKDVRINPSPFEEWRPMTNPAYYGYDTYLANDGYVYTKPRIVDYNNDGADEILVLENMGWSDGWVFLSYGTNAESLYTGSVTARIVPTYAMTFGFFEYEGIVYFISSDLIVASSDIKTKEYYFLYASVFGVNYSYQTVCINNDKIELDYVHWGLYYLPQLNAAAQGGGN